MDRVGTGWILLAAGLLIAAKAPKHQQLTPLGDRSEWVTPDDYPAEAMRKGEYGTTAFRLEVGPEGTVKGCDVTDSSGSAQLDEVACALLTERARFSPAKENGKPVTAYYSNRVRWMIPIDGAPEKLMNMDVVVDLDLLPDGTIADCRALNAINGRLMPEYCNGLTQSAAFARFGKPTKPTHVRLRNSVEVTSKDEAP